MRERGSSTARPTEKGVGGLLIGARPVDFGASFRADSVGFGASVASIRSVSARPVDFGASIRADFVAICGLPLGVSCRFGVLLVSRFGRFGRVASVDSARRFGRVLSISARRFVPTPC